MISGDTAQVVVNEVWNPDTQYAYTTNLTVTLKKLDGRWLIDDIACVSREPLVATVEPTFLATPEEVVKGFYDWYLASSGYNEQAGTVLSPLGDGSYRSRPHLTEAFVHKVDEIIASFDKGGYDPFLCAQDVPGRTTFDTAVTSGDEASVIVHEVWNPNSEYELITDVTVVLQKVTDGWKINDIQCNLPDPLAPVIESSPATSPEEAVKSFYDWYLDSSAYVEHTGEQLNPLIDGGFRSNPFLTDGLVQKVDAIIVSFDKGGFDPFLCAQDLPESVSLEEPVVSGEIARVVVRTSFEGHAFTVALLREAEGWKMSDVFCEVGEEEEQGSSYEGWQTFADEGYGFQLRCPASWTFEELKLRSPEETPDAEKVLKRVLVFQPQGWDGVAAPLHLQIAEGTQEEFERFYVPASVSENLTINGNEVIKEIEEITSEMKVVRYIFRSPAYENARIVLLDYISGFPQRADGHNDVIAALEQILGTLQFSGK